MAGPSKQRSIDIPIERLPRIDEHAVIVDADPEGVWEALVATVPGAFDGAAARRVAHLLGCAELERRGDPCAIGSTIPGFVVARAVPSAMLALEGNHRFSNYALAFRIDPLPDARTTLRAETRAEFPGLRGRAYRTFVIGTRGHVLVVRRAAGDQAPSGALGL